MRDLHPQPVKDPNAAHPVAAAWRPVFREIVHSFVDSDYSLSRHVQRVRPLESKTSKQMQTYIQGYGATLVDLPEESWHTSVAQWMESYWDVLVDLWTDQEGRSDLVLHARVFEIGNDFEIEIDSISVP
jgi:hypothetical protein